LKLADVQFADHERVMVARLTGEVDLSNADGIESAIAEATPSHAVALVLDVSDVDYLDSAGIHLVYRLREKLRARGQSLRLVIPADSPANDALRLAGVPQAVNTAQTLDAALAEFAPRGAPAPDASPAEASSREPTRPEVPGPGAV